MEKRETKFEIYLTCVNRAIIALIGSAHYLNVRATEDIIYNLILSVVGFFGFVYLLGMFILILIFVRIIPKTLIDIINLSLARILQLITTLYSTRKRHSKLIQQLQQYMKYKELPYSLQRRLLIYYNYRNKKGYERDKIIINHVSPYLREVRTSLKIAVSEIVYVVL